MSTYKPIPKLSILDNLESFEYNGEKRWRSRDRKLIFTCDGLHGEVEVFKKEDRIWVL